MTETKEQKINKKMKVSDVVNEYPDIIPLLMGYGLHCVGCHYSDIDTLESGAKLHGMSDEDVEMMINDCNELLEELEEEND
jgi:hybrid cluster-associated redox disulfide protein